MTSYVVSSPKPSSNASSCLPDTAGKVAAVAFSIVLIAATTITVLILLQQNPHLNTIFYPVFGVMGGLGFLLFVCALINMCKQTPEAIKKQDTSSHYTPFPIYSAHPPLPMYPSPAPFGYPYPMYPQYPPMMPHPMPMMPHSMPVSMRKDLLMPPESI